MQAIRDKIRAGYPGIYLVSHEEPRAEAMLLRATQEISYHLHAWSITQGRLDVGSGATFDDADPLAVLDSIGSLPESTVLVLRDYHLFLADPNPLLYRKFK